MICRMTKEQRVALTELMDAKLAMVHAPRWAGLCVPQRERLNKAQAEFERLFANEGDIEDNTTQRTRQ